MVARNARQIKIDQSLDASGYVSSHFRETIQCKAVRLRSCETSTTKEPLAMVRWSLIVIVAFTTSETVANYEKTHNKSKQTASRSIDSAFHTVSS